MAAAQTTASDAPHAARGRVHFDDTCVLIPDAVVQSRMPRLIKKSYSLPLWRKRTNSIPPANVVEAAPGPSPDERGVVFTVSVPSFSRSRSLSRSEGAHQPLAPCIVNADAHGAEPASRAAGHARRPSLPLPPHSDVVTVPLRPCCPECVRITEECLRMGAAWEEKFTRGARRLLNSSTDGQAHARAQRHRRVQDDVPGFGAIVSVDEIDKRHGTSSDSISAAAAAAVADAPNPPPSTEEILLPSFSRRLQIADKDAKASSNTIVEEDEAEISDTGFPLPSPRRTPHDSPSASSSHLPRGSPDDNVRLLLQAVSDARALERALTSEAGPTASRINIDTRCAHMLHVGSQDHVDNDDYDDDDDHDEAGGNRVSVYYTPDSSPAIPALEPPSIVSSPETPTPVTPPTPHSIAFIRSGPPPIPIPIPAASRVRTRTPKFAPELDADAGSADPNTLAYMHSLSLSPSQLSAPPSPPPPPPPKELYRPRYSMSGSPDLSDLPVLTASPPGSPGSPRKRAGLHIPHLPRAGSFLRAGAEVLRGVGSLGSGTGPVPMSV